MSGEDSITIFPMQHTFVVNDREIPLIQVLQWKAALGLELRTGMAFSSRSVAAFAKRMLGLPSRTSKQQVFDILVDMKRQMDEEIARRNTGGG